MRDRYVWGAILLVAFFLASFMAFMTGAWAWEHDPNSPYKGWADKQQVMEAAKPRFSCGVGGNCSCCDGSEIVKTKFRVAKDNSDAWQWLNPKTGKWLDVPPDIVHWGESTPDKQAVAFEYPIGSGTLRCFFPPQDEGG